MKIIKGCLISMAKNFEFDVIAQSCNCFCRQKRGIAVDMVENFNTDTFLLEDPKYAGDYDKLGRVDYGVHRQNGSALKLPKTLTIVNCYTQFHWKEPGKYGIPCDYDAFTLCMRKINKEFKGLHLGLPYLISCGLAGASEEKILKILEEELVDMTVTLVRKD